MILADTNVFIDFWNKPTEELSDVFEKEDIVICGVVRAELLHGAVSDKDFANITMMLEAFDEKSLSTEDWQLLGSNLYKLRKRHFKVRSPVRFGRCKADVHWTSCTLVALRRKSP